jgi:hypothetical protein
VAILRINFNGRKNMIKKAFVLGVSLIFCILLCLSLRAEEGMWLLDSIKDLPLDSLKSLGLELDAEQIYDPEGGSLADAAVRVGGASGSFVSPDGLIITNHHVAFTAIQRRSTPVHNYLKEGFYARSREEELPAIGYNIYVIKSFRDVTEKVLSVVNEKASGIKRYKAIEKAKKKVIHKAEENKDLRCDLVSLFGGSQHYLFSYFKIKDVRIVYVPPESIGNYGGEIDNWMWPRHVGDFAFLRAYVAPDGKSSEYSPENVPYHSSVYLPLSATGISDGDLVMLFGFPGTTKRYQTSFSIEQMISHDYPLDIKARQDVISILKKASDKDSSVAMRLSSQIKGLNNYLKKNQGMLEGFKRTDLLSTKREEEEQLRQFINENPDLKRRYGDILPGLKRLFEEKRKSADEEFLVNWMVYRCKFLNFACNIYKWSLEKEKKDSDREPSYQDRDTSEARSDLEDAQVNLVPSADREIFIYFLKRALALPDGQRIEAVDNILKGIADEDKNDILEEFAHDLYQQTRLGSVKERLKMFSMSKKELLKQKDPFIDFAAGLEEEREKLRDQEKEFEGTLSKLEPKLIQAYREWKGERLYPDANRTIRFNYGKVKGYQPRDAVNFRYITTFSGVMNKNTGSDPFDVPEELKLAYAKKDYGIYIDTSIGDVPVNFLSDCDVTNGNSGSPVLNGKGELVGLVFDGNYESISSDYSFEPELTRTINVDIRYLLFLLDKVYHAENLLKELNIN